ncbi:phosphatase PAP2 family protein [Qipengyuania spongiae]|uniref:Phosphatase PAP2 family protein n=1 Tax=Qipengyuania spongiae TaxID=2909673 RepID=A0ABY5SZP4_9SPHN|nr:phosphatase PAP2 family protein [Qipengyuania spongiae]UVI38164.1 phosphatase PAP2 family protein [Qipengyuania spongiae]
MNDLFALLLLIGALGYAALRAQPCSKLATGVIAVAAFFGITLLAALAAASLAIGGGEYIDPLLVQIDETFLPFFDWKATTLSLPNDPRLYALLTEIYASLNMQPAAFMLVVLLFGHRHDYHEFMGVWSMALALCILPFAWLPAQSPYIYYGVTEEEMVGAGVTLPWAFFPVLEGIREGHLQALSMNSLSGLVTIPSFHAAGGTVLIWLWWRFRILRWPMVGLNAMMIVAAVPIGSHYVVDIVAGVLVGLLAIVVTKRTLYPRRSGVASDRIILNGIAPPAISY